MDALHRWRDTAKIYMRPRTRRQQGAVLIETSLILIPILFAAGLAVELLHSNQLRHVATLALYQTGRVASTTQAMPETMLAAFRQAIAPLFAGQGRKGGTQTDTHSSEQLFSLRTGLPLWQVEIISPTPATFRDFADPALTRMQGRPVIRNSYMAQQHQKHMDAGWPGGRGPLSGQTVFQANTLTLRLTLLYSSTVPGARLIMKGLAWLGRERGDLMGRAWRQGLLVIVVEADVMMQGNFPSLDQYTFSSGSTKPGGQAEIKLEQRTTPPAVHLRPLAQTSIGSPPPAAEPSQTITRAESETTGTQAATIENKKNAGPLDLELCGALLCCTTSSATDDK